MSYHWFVDLLASVITSFADLTLKFVTQHIDNTCLRKNTNSLNVEKQGNNTLYQFTNRFMQAKCEVFDFDTNMTINAYTMGLKEDFHMEISLTIQKVSTLPEFISMAKLYIAFKIFYRQRGATTLSSTLTHKRVKNLAS